MKKNLYSVFLLVVGFSLLLYLLFHKQAYVFNGFSMGTTYKVVIYDQFIHSSKLRKIKVAVEEELYRLNQLFSTFEESSELSKLNIAKVGDEFHPSDELLNVLILAKKVNRLSKGAFDPTVDPLVKLWGFGNDTTYSFPTKLEVDKVLAKVGYEKIIITNDSILKNEDVSIDLASIAKGYAVDAIVKIIKGFKQYDFFVEIGGEIYVNGDEFYKMGWDVHVTNPDKNDESIAILQLKNKGIATSGSYRNYRIHDGKKYQHIIDPRNGYPVFNELVSVTIIADSVVFADALATGVLVMGTEQGLTLVNSLDGVEAVLVEKKEDELKVIKSDGI